MLSARNKIKGTIKEINEGAVNGIVKLELAGGSCVSATISMESIKELGLEPGKEATAVVKATDVMMALDFVRISARNQLKGTVASVEDGAVNSIVKLDMAGGIGITSTISREAVEELGLKPGKEAVAVIKATNVMISVD